MNIDANKAIEKLQNIISQQALQIAILQVRIDELMQKSEEQQEPKIS